MVGEQQIVAIDFLGLNTNNVRVAVERNGNSELSNEEKLNHEIAALALEAATLGRPRPERGLFHGLDPSFRGSSRPVRNIYGQNIVATFPNGDSRFGTVGGSGGVPCNSSALLCNMVLTGNGGRSVGNVGVALENSVSHSVGVSVVEENYNPNLSPVPREERQLVECGSGFFSLTDKEKVKAGGKPYKDLSDTDLQLLTKDECRRYVQQRGMRNSARNKSATLQQTFSPKTLWEDKINERRGQNWASNIFHLPGKQDVIKLNNRNASCSQVRPVAVPLVTHREPIFEGQISSAHLIDQGGVSLNSSLYFALSEPDLTTHFGSVAGGNQQVTRHLGSESSSAPFSTLPAVSTAKAGFQERPLASNPLGGPPRAQLTVFYGGAVNVFDDVPMDKANEIMLLAGNTNSLLAKIGIPVAEECPLMTSPIFTNFAGIPTSPSSCSPVPPSTKQVISEKIESTGQANFRSQLVAHQSQANQGSTCTGNKLGTSRPSTPSTSMMSDNQPNVTKALPQARKASLARFLEKRKERVRSKNPYSIIKPSPEHTLLEREKISSPNCSALFSHPVAGFKECGEENIVHMIDSIDEGLASCGMVNED